MSSYLNFYLKPKGGDKPLHFISYSRNSNVYQKFYENNASTFIGNGDEYNYSELTSEKCRWILDDAREDLRKAKENFDSRVEAFQKLTNVSAEAINEYTTDYMQTKEYIKELEETVAELECIYYWVSDVEFSDFEKVLTNID